MPSPREVTRVAREVGTEGKLGGQAQVSGVGGTWKDLTDNVNFMASNLTDQVRGIVKVVTAVANGNLRQKLTVQAKGEVAALADTINNMTDTLATFAEQVINVAREVGVEGRLGGQANVPGAAGTWKDLTGNVNLLAANLTTQVRAIAEVATAVTKGDLTRSIQVETRGEVAELKDNINTMIANLRETTERNREQDWLKTNLARFTSMLQGQRELNTVGQMLLAELVPLVQAQQGTIYQMAGGDDDEPDAAAARQLRAAARPARAHPARRGARRPVRGGEEAHPAHRRAAGLHPHQLQPRRGAAVEHRRAAACSSKGRPRRSSSWPRCKPSRRRTSPSSSSSRTSIGVVLNTIEATMRTEGLLTQSQQLTVELQSRQSELQQTNEELGTKARLLAEQNAEVERKNARGRAGPPRARGKGRRAGAHLEVQVRVPGEHVARAAHAAQLHPHPQPAARRERRRQPVAQAGRVRPQHQLVRLRPAAPHQRHSRSLEDRVRHGHGRGRGDLLRRPARQHRPQLPARGRGQEPAVPRATSPPTCRARLTSDSEAPAADPQEPALQRRQVHRAGPCRCARRLRHARAGAPITRCSARPSRSSPSPSRTPASASRRRSSGSSSRPSSRPTPARRASTAAPAWAWPSAASWPRCWAAKSGSPACTGRAARSRSTCRCTTPGPTRRHRRGRRGDAQRPTVARDSRVLPVAREEHIADDRDDIEEGDPVLLIIEDDPHYARILLGLARDKGFKGIVATQGRDGPVARPAVPPDGHLARYLPARHARLDGAQQPQARPGDAAHPGADRHARGRAPARPRRTAPSPTSSRRRRPRAWRRPSTASRTSPPRAPSGCSSSRTTTSSGSRSSSCSATTTSRSTAVGTGGEALEALLDQPFDCVVLDLRLPDMTGFELLEKMQAEPALRDVPVVVFTGKELTADEEARLKTMAKSIVLKDVQSPERLLDETALFLHRVVADLPAEKQKMLERLHGSNEVLRGRKVLVVDDDARNIFALTSLLENQEMEVISATNGRQAIELIQSTPDLSMVLMDIMMPEMDGYETMREIRKDPQFRTLPILALTAKAMKGDREKCLDAGATDYIAKPVNTDQLLSLMRVWLFR